MQAAIIGTTAGVAALIGSTLTVIREIREARDKVKGVSKTLNDTSLQLTELERSLDLVKEEAALQTAAVEQQVQVITDRAGELSRYFAKLANQQQRSPTSQFAHALKTGNNDDKELQKILERLDRARDLLAMRILVAQVGLVGNLQDGFRVAFGVLAETNEKVKQVLGTNLVLMDQLGPRAAQQRADGILRLESADEEEFAIPEQVSKQDTTSITDTSIYNNITLGQARMMTGNVGVEEWQRMAGRKTTIAHNRFGNDIRIMTGDVGGQAAAGFNKNFWN